MPPLWRGLQVRASRTLTAADYYPPIKKSGGLTRELPLADSALLEAISRYLDERMALKKPLKSNDPLLLSQKGGFYSPNTLQDHMATMLREWSGIDRASSHSGRRTLATNLLHDQGEHLKTVQKVLGHKSAASTTIYQDVTEQEVRKVLKKAGKNYDSLPMLNVEKNKRTLRSYADEMRQNSIGRLSAWSGH